MTSKWTAHNSEGYEAPAGLAVDIALFTVTDDGLRVLVTWLDDGRAALPGGFVGREESAEQTVQRKLTEKTGVGSVYFEQLRLYSRPDRDRRGWIPSMAFLALVTPEVKPTDSEAEWVDPRDLPTMAYDHAEMIADGLERLQGKLWWSNVAVGVLPGDFTISQARRVYEAVAGQKYDPSTFSRDLQATSLIEATGETQKADGAGRPAALYRFASHELQWGTGRRKRVSS